MPAALYDMCALTDTASRCQRAGKESTFISPVVWAVYHISFYMLCIPKLNAHKHMLSQHVFCTECPQHLDHYIPVYIASMYSSHHALYSASMCSSRHALYKVHNTFLASKCKCKVLSILHYYFCDHFAHRFLRCVHHLLILTPFAQCLLTSNPAEYTWRP